VAGSAPLTVGMTWDAVIQNGVETQCRSAIVQPQSGASLSLQLDSGSVFSDSNNLVSFTAFSLTNSMTADAMSRFVYAVAPTSPPVVNQTLTPIPMTTVISPASATTFNPTLALYTCGSTGVYFVSASVGVLPHMATQAQITTATQSIELTRTSVLYDGVTTLSRNTLVQCAAGQTIQFNMLSGTTVNSVSTNQYNLTTFAVVPYEPLNIQQPVAWAVSKWYISYNNQGGQANLDPFYFSNVTVNVGSAYSFNSRTVTATQTGYYYIYISAGAGVGLSGRTYTFSLMRGTQVLFGVEHLSSAEGATDVYGHGEVVHLTAGDIIRVVALAPSYIYSSLAGYEAEWMGMLLYTA